MSDIIVIGGGIAGVSVAARLSEAASVTVLERETALGYHASGRSAAMFEDGYGNAPTVALTRASRDYLVGGGYLSHRGFMVVGTEASADAFAADVAAMGLAALSPGEARGMVPILAPQVDRAAHDPDAWDIDTDRLIQDFAAAVRRAGGSVRTGAGVTGIARAGKGWQVTAGSERFEAAALVNAAGAWADEVARMAGAAPLGLRPLRRSMARIPAPDGHDVRRWPMVCGAGESWYARPDAGALLVSPAEEDPVPEPHDAWADDMVLAEGLARYEAHVTEQVTRLLASWAGLRTFTADRTLALGPDPLVPGLFWCAGQGGYGFQTAPAASRLLADRVLGRTPGLPPEFVSALDPARFHR